MAECLSQDLVPLVHWPKGGRRQLRMQLFTAFCMFLSSPQIWVWFKTWREIICPFCVSDLVSKTSRLLPLSVCLKDCLDHVFNFHLSNNQINLPVTFLQHELSHKTKLRRHRLSTVRSKRRHQRTASLKTFD